MLRFFTLTLLFLNVFHFGYALKCYYHVIQLDEKGEPKTKEYECSTNDKYCVNLGGFLDTTVKNLTFGLKSCESELKAFIDPISKRIGDKLDDKCVGSDPIHKTVGPLTYWLNCCQTDLCNGAVSVKAMTIFAILPILITSLIFKN